MPPPNPQPSCHVPSSPVPLQAPCAARCPRLVQLTYTRFPMSCMASLLSCDAPLAALAAPNILVHALQAPAPPPSSFDMHTTQAGPYRPLAFTAPLAAGWHHRQCMALRRVPPPHAPTQFCLPCLLVACLLPSVTHSTCTERTARGVWRKRGVGGTSAPVARCVRSLHVSMPRSSCRGSALRAHPPFIQTAVPA